MLPVILQYVQSLGHVVFTEGDFNLNLIGVRANNPVPNSFDDMLAAVYKVGGVWLVRSWPMTSDPGLYWLNHPMRRDGTAILTEGQHRGAFKLGLHKGSYPALIQAKPVKVYRDANKDSVLDMDPDSIQEGYFGIHIHAASKDPWGDSRRRNQVDRWSAGCQVVADPVNYREMIALVEKSTAMYGKTLTYTLVNEPPGFQGAEITLEDF
jgi:hypothetical protein